MFYDVVILQIPISGLHFFIHTTNMKYWGVKCLEGEPCPMKYIGDKKEPCQFQFKIVTQEGAELISSHRHTESIAMYGISSSRGEKKLTQQSNPLHQANERKSTLKWVRKTETQGKKRKEKKEKQQQQKRWHLFPFFCHDKHGILMYVT